MVIEQKAQKPINFKSYFNYGEFLRLLNSIIGLENHLNIKVILPASINIKFAKKWFTTRYFKVSRFIQKLLGFD